MNKTIARALILDAYSQVMDNKVFRLLVLVCFAMIAPAFLIAFREDGIHLLFGWKSFTWQQFFDAFHAPMPAVEDVHIVVIQAVQEKIVQGLAGSLGLLFCIAATAFFVPRMLEKGAADTLFTKPISRIVLLVARYCAGLMFVGALSFVLVLGIHLGLLVMSGYSDPAFLWCTLTLVYVYALVQTVSVVVGVFTRNSVAAILCTLVFFAFNGCVHGAWVANQWGIEHQAAERNDDADAAADEPTILKALQVTLDVLHYTLPKTNDADVLTKKLRTIVVGRTTILEDEEGKLAVDRNPDDYHLEAGLRDLRQEPATWTSKNADGSEAGRITLSRRSRVTERPAPSGSVDQKPRKSRRSAGQAADEFSKSLEGRAGVVDSPVRSQRHSNAFSVETVRWSEAAAGGKLARERLFFTVDEWMYEVDVGRSADEVDRVDPEGPVRHFMDGLRVTRSDSPYLVSPSWYENKFGWSSPLKFNVFFSILSSLAFAASMLGIAAWRLSRIDF